MITEIPDEKMVEEWRALYAEHRKALKPNRKTGAELEEYFLSKYEADEYADEEFIEACRDNITLNPHSRKKLPEGKTPEIHSYITGDVKVGIDLVSGEMHVECDDIMKVVYLYDDLFAYRGLDEDDLENPFLVAEYVNRKKRDMFPLFLIRYSFFSVFE